LIDARRPAVNPALQTPNPAHPAASQKMGGLQGPHAMMAIDHDRPGFAHYVFCGLGGKSGKGHQFRALNPANRELILFPTIDKPYRRLSRFEKRIQMIRGDLRIFNFRKCLSHDFDEATQIREDAKPGIQKSCNPRKSAYCGTRKLMRLYQNQIWRKGDTRFRIVHLERLSVEYKEIHDDTPEESKHVTVTKKEFCRLIKSATLEG